MNKKLLSILIIVPVIAIASIFIFKNTSAPETEASVSRSGLTLDLDFGNNDGTDPVTVYDSSGFGRHATSTTGSTMPACNNSFCDFDGGDYMTANATNVFNSAEISIALKFTPDFAANDGSYHYFFGDVGNVNYFMKMDTVNADRLAFNLGGTRVINVLAYSQYWRVGKENIIIFRATSGSNKVYLNGTKLSVAETIDWTASDSSSFVVGARSSIKDLTFDGRIHYLKVWNRLLTDQEVAILSADRETSVQTPSRTGLVGHWTMDANDYNGTTVLDKSGRDNHGTDTNMDTSNLVAGKTNQALDFNGSDEYIGVINATSLGPTNAITISAWVKADSISHAGGGNNPRIINATNYILYSTQAGTLICQTNGVDDITTSVASAVTLNNWIHFVCTYDSATGDRIIYKNGVNVASELTLSGNITAGNYLYIGDNNTGTRLWDGKIDDVRIYNYALSAEEVSNLYNSAKTKYTASAPLLGLVGYWNMDTADVSATKVYDKSGFGNHGTPTGFYTGLAPTSTPGKINQAIDFDGMNGAVNADVVANDMSPLSGTIVLWAKAEANVTSFIIGGNTNSRTYLSRHSSGFFRVTKGNPATDMNFTATALNTWHQLVLTWDNGSMSGYQDGVLINTLAFTDTTTAGTALKISSFNTGGFNFDGAIDDVRIYNRALSADEVSALYKSSARKYVR